MLLWLFVQGGNRNSDYVSDQNASDQTNKAIKKKLLYSDSKIKNLLLIGFLSKILFSISTENFFLLLFFGFLVNSRILVISLYFAIDF